MADTPTDHALHVAITRLPLADIAHALDQTVEDSWVAVNRAGDVALVVRKGAGWTLAKPLPRKLQPPEEIP